MRELFVQGGWVLVVILGFSVLAWTIVVRKWLSLRAEQAEGLDWADAALGHLSRREHERARRLCRSRRGLAGRLMYEAVATREPQRRFFEVHLAPLVAGEQARLRGGLPVVGTVAALCPLLGLLGTVLGMITTFGGITAGGGVEPDALAKGISQALITTQAGLVMALPLLLMHGYLRAKIDRFLDAVGLRIKKVETLVCGD